MHVNLILLAGGTAFNILADEGSEPWPPELSSDQLSGFKKTRMTGGFVVMAPFKDGAAEGVVGGDIDTSFIGEDFRLHLPVSKTGVKRKGNILVHRLECLQDEGITSRS